MVFIKSLILNFFEKYSNKFFTIGLPCCLKRPIESGFNFIGQPNLNSTIMNKSNNGMKMLSHSPSIFDHADMRNDPMSKANLFKCRTLINDQSKCFNLVVFDSYQNFFMFIEPRITSQLSKKLAKILPNEVQFQTIIGEGAYLLAYHSLTKQYHLIKYNLKVNLEQFTKALTMEYKIK
jgi:hypothetical protein